MAQKWFAAAKLNLFLHVGPRGIDGYHPVCSLVAFADVGDQVTIHCERPMGLEIHGPFAGDLGDGPGNLVLRARDALLHAAADRRTAFGLSLRKALPVASGLGGGSADAAATLLAIRDALGLVLAGPVWDAMALDLGADVPACLNGAAAIATGRGERLATPPTFPDLDAVLVNPGVPSPTATVYRAYDETVQRKAADAPNWPGTLRTPMEMAQFLSACRNDLEAPARELRPAIGEALEALRGEPEALLARMSGSGATCFALCAGPVAAGRLAARLAASRPDWWVRACRLGGSRA